MAWKAGFGWHLCLKLISNTPHAQLLPNSRSDTLPGHHSLNLRRSQTHYKSIPPYWCWVKIYPAYQLPWGIQFRTCSHSMFNSLVVLGPSESHMFFKTGVKWAKYLHQSLKAAASSLILKFKALPSSCWFGGGWHLPVNIQRHGLCLWGKSGQLPVIHWCSSSFGSI